MKKAKIILGLGIWLAILPYLGFPYFMRNLIISISALLVAYIGLMLYKHHSIVEGNEEVIFDNFSENKDFVEGVTEEILEKESDAPEILTEETNSQ